MARIFKNVSTGVKVETSNERVAAMYADHPSWKEVKKRARGAAANDGANGSAGADTNSNSADTSAASTGLAKDSDNEED